MRLMPIILYYMLVGRLAQNRRLKGTIFDQVIICALDVTRSFLDEDIICIGYTLKLKSCQRNNENECGISTQIFSLQFRYRTF